MTCVSTLTPAQRFNYETLLTRELQQPHEAWLLDDAVYGALTLEARVDFLACYGLDDTAPNQALLSLSIDAALRAGA